MVAGARRVARPAPRVRTRPHWGCGEPHQASCVVILFPAIDLKDGACVRLEKGDMSRATIFQRDPAAQAHAFASLGFEYLHVVDVDGSLAAKLVNCRAAGDIMAVTDRP